MKKKIAMLLTATLLFTGAFTGCKQTPAPAPNSEAPTTEAPASQAPTSEAPSADASIPDGVKDKKKVAVIRNLTSDDHTVQFMQGIKDTLEPFGWTVDTFISDGNDEKFQTLVDQAIAKDYNGLIISHGKADYSYDMLKPAVDKGLKIVTFDTVIKGPNGETLPGVTTTSQNDAKLAELSLNEILSYAKDGKPVNVIKVWFGPGVPPLDARDIIYKKMESDGKIKTLENIGPATLDNVQADVANKMAAVLPKYKEGDVDVVWGSWDEMAKGAYTALKEAGRKDIKLVSIDVSNQDMNLMRESDVWTATAAVDPHLIGQQDARLLAKKFAGEETPDTYQLDASLIKTTQLKPDTNMLNLKDVIDGWGKTDDFDEPWMKLLNK